MSISNRVKALIERLLDVAIIGSRYLPRGTSLGHDLARDLPGFRAEIVFDVGANVGQSAERFLACFPGATLFCFEPVERTYRELQAAVGNHEHVRCYHLAMGASPGAGWIGHSRASDLSVLTRDAQVPPTARPDAGEAVTIQTVDGFCATAGITHISYLKIDTEGHDLEVLKGAEALLSGHDIDLVEVEAGMNPDNTLHVSFEVLKQHLEARRYRLFALYEQMHEWTERAPQLRRTNPVFISPRVIAANTPVGGAR